MLGCQSRTKTLAYRPPILLPHQLQYLLPKFRFMSMVRGPTHTAMLQPCGALLPISLPQSLRLPVAHLQELAGIYNPQMLAPHTRQHFHPSQLPLAHLCPPQSDLLSEVLLRGHFYFGEKGTLLSWNNSLQGVRGVRGVRQESRKFGRAIAVGTKSHVPLAAVSRPAATDDSFLIPLPGPRACVPAFVPGEPFAPQRPHNRAACLSAHSRHSDPVDAVVLPGG